METATSYQIKGHIVIKSMDRMRLSHVYHVAQKRDQSFTMENVTKMLLSINVYIYKNVSPSRLLSADFTKIRICLRICCIILT